MRSTCRALTARAVAGGNRAQCQSRNPHPAQSCYWCAQVGGWMTKCCVWAYRAAQTSPSRKIMPRKRMCHQGTQVCESYHAAMFLPYPKNPIPPFLPFLSYPILKPASEVTCHLQCTLQLRVIRLRKNVGDTMSMQNFT